MIDPPAPDWFRDIWDEFRDGMKAWRGGPPPRQYWDKSSRAPNSFPTGKPRGSRKPDIKKLIEAAERDGKTVTSITTPDGVTLHFDKVENAEPSNPWLDDLKVTKQ